MLYHQLEYEKIIKKYFPTSNFHLDIEIIKNPPKEYIKNFFNQLTKHERYHELKNDIFYDEEMYIFVQVHNRFPYSEVQDLSEEELFFLPFMDKNEIKRIFNINSASDYLVKKNV